MKTSPTANVACSFTLICVLLTPVSYYSGQASEFWCGNETALHPLVEAKISVSILTTDPDQAQWYEFAALTDAWKSQSRFLSSINEIAMLPSYQRIIGMGRDAIPLILASLRSEGDNPDHWFWALRSISNDNPVEREHQGDMQRMAAAWITWGEREGYAS